MSNFGGVKLSDAARVTAGKIAAVLVGAFAILLGIYFKGENVPFLVRLAFAVAASANLPAILMLLFWKKTTARGIAASVRDPVLGLPGKYRERTPAMAAGLTDHIMTVGDILRTPQILAAA
jgi:cation/acetate symporter